MSCRYVTIKNCIINRKDPINGSVDAIDNSQGVGVVNGRYITLKNNNITHVSIGIAAGSYDLVIKGNEIHHNSHDGIRIYGGDNWLIESNKIHDIDDGLNDNSVELWNRHVDGIQQWDLFAPVTNLVVRGNFFYHIEAMGIMTEGKGKSANWIFENNLFGPVGGIVFHLGTDVYSSLIFRHNTIFEAPNDVWTSISGRTMNEHQYSLALWSDVAAVNPGYKFYNNVLTTVSTVPLEYGFVSSNLYCDKVSGYPYEAIPGNIDDYLKTGKIPGQLLPGNKTAIDAGTTQYSSELLIDFNGKKRDTKPDIGAFEY